MSKGLEGSQPELKAFDINLIGSQIDKSYLSEIFH